MSDMQSQIVDKQKSDAVLAMLVSATEGPREAYAILCLTIRRLNDEFCDEPSSIDQLCEEIAISLRSITRHISQ